MVNETALRDESRAEIVHGWLQQVDYRVASFQKDRNAIFRLRTCCNLLLLDFAASPIYSIILQAATCDFSSAFPPFSCLGLFLFSFCRPGVVNQVYMFSQRGLILFYSSFLTTITLLRLSQFLLLSLLFSLAFYYDA